MQKVRGVATCVRHFPRWYLGAGPLCSRQVQVQAAYTEVEPAAPAARKPTVTGLFKGQQVDIHHSLAAPQPMQPIILQ